MFIVLQAFIFICFQKEEAASQRLHEFSDASSETSQERDLDGNGPFHAISEKNVITCSEKNREKSRPRTAGEALSVWGEKACERLKTLLERTHGGVWVVKVGHIEPVKSYAPHVMHVVLDIHCSPVVESSVNPS
jgi:hypothetical protein